MENLVIVGGGPAGLTAAIYAARADLSPIVITGQQPGGQLMLTSEVENYPGFPEGIAGPDLMANMRRQAERFGARLLDEQVQRVNFTGRPLLLTTDSGESAVIEAKSVIIATGASARWLGVPGEKQLIGHGVSACATCDGFFYRNREVVVVGGGDTALEEALFLTKFARKVTIIHRRGEFRASKIMRDRARRNEKVGFIFDAMVEEVLGESRVEAVRLRDVRTGEARDYRTDGVFVAIGYTPNTRVFADGVELDEQGYVRAYEHSRTSVPGVFVAGDVEDRRYRQAVTAAAAGARAALDAEAYLEALTDSVEAESVENGAGQLVDESRVLATVGSSAE